MTRGRALSLCLALLLALGNTGCVGAALIEAGGREASDHGHYAKYENKSYGRHFVDSLFDSDDCD